MSAAMMMAAKVMALRLLYRRAATPLSRSSWLACSTHIHLKVSSVKNLEAIDRSP
jgi:hypothetical protein